MFTYLACSQDWNALRRATWSLHLLPASFLCTQPKRLCSRGVSKGSGNVVLEAIVAKASPTLSKKLKINNNKISLHLIYYIHKNYRKKEYSIKWRVFYSQHLTAIYTWSLTTNSFKMKWFLVTGSRTWAMNTWLHGHCFNNHLKSYPQWNWKKLHIYLLENTSVNNHFAQTWFYRHAS